VPTSAVVYVHGLWLTGLEGTLLRRRLGRALAAQTAAFSYPSVRLGIADNAAALLSFLSGVRADTLHLVGHSLGGLVILKAFESSASNQLPPGRIVLLGSPLQGSRTASRVASRLPFGHGILGKGVREELLVVRKRRWNGARDLAVIAGNLSIGLGRLVGRHDSPSDGTVFLYETALDGAKECLTLGVSHTGLPFSKEVSHQTAAFLATGKFIR
jgi:pimeloyl-ACP methyl ester carboxylesterase